MPKLKKNHSHSRKSQVPILPGTNAKACTKCNLWFAALPRQRVCDGCQPAWVLSRRDSGKDTLSTPRLGKRAGQRGGFSRVKAGSKVIFSEYLGLTFVCEKNDPRYARLETIVLAHELATKERWEGQGPKKSDVTPQNVSSTPLSLTRDQVKRITRRNVESGLQGRCDLER